MSKSDGGSDTHTHTLSLSQKKKKKKNPQLKYWIGSVFPRSFSSVSSEVEAMQRINRVSLLPQRYPVGGVGRDMVMLAKSPDASGTRLGLRNFIIIPNAPETAAVIWRLKRGCLEG